MQLKRKIFDVPKMVKDGFMLPARNWKYIVIPFKIYQQEAEKNLVIRQG